MNHPTATAAFAVAATSLCAIILLPSAGGYGSILWAYHPLLLTVAFLFLLPLGLRFRSSRRFTHVMLQGLGVVTAVVGYAIAFYVHASNGKVHIPWHKDWIRLLHVLTGFLVLFGLVLLAVGGSLRYYSSSFSQYFQYSPSLVGAIHAKLGVFVWLVGLIPYGLGFYIMIAHNPISPVTFLVSCSAVGGVTYMVLSSSSIFFSSSPSSKTTSFSSSEIGTTTSAT